MDAQPQSESQPETRRRARRNEMNAQPQSESQSQSVKG
jgi:hypothetical protein